MANGPLQTTYTDRQPLGFEGQKVDGQEFNARTMLCGEVAGLNWGRPVARSGGDKIAVLLTAANVAEFVGITLRDVSVRPSAGNMYPKGYNMAVLDMGSVFVKAGEAVTPADPPLFDTATNKFVKTASGTTVALPSGWKFRTSAPVNGLVELHGK